MPAPFPGACVPSIGRTARFVTGLRARTHTHTRLFNMFSATLRCGLDIYRIRQARFGKMHLTPFCIAAFRGKLSYNHFSAVQNPTAPNPCPEKTLLCAFRGVARYVFQSTVERNTAELCTDKPCGPSAVPQQDRSMGRYQTVKASIRALRAFIMVFRAKPRLTRICGAHITPTRSTRL